MNREVHVRFWEGLAVRFPWATQLILISLPGDVPNPSLPYILSERFVRG